MARGSHAARLRLLIELAENRLRAVSSAFWAHPRLDRIFPPYLLTLHASVRATVPLMRAAEARARELAPGDPVAARLAPYYARHAQEELGHDEWLLEDIEAMGLRRQDAFDRAPPPEVASMIGAQYYWLLHAHPVALLGGFAVLEGSPPRRDVLDEVVARTGLPRAGLRAFYKHADLDPHHRDDLDELLDELPLTGAQAELVGLSALHAVEHLAEVIDRAMLRGAAGAAS